MSGEKAGPMGILPILNETPGKKVVVMKYLLKRTALMAVTMLLASLLAFVAFALISGHGHAGHIRHAGTSGGFAGGAGAGPASSDALR